MKSLTVAAALAVLWGGLGLKGAPAAAQADAIREASSGASVPSPASPTLRDLIRGAVLPQGSADREQLFFVVMFNKSCNVENGIPGQWARSEIRGLLNFFLVKDEALEVHLFQANYQPEEKLDLHFDPEQRLALYDELDKFCANAGSPTGGSDVERAKYECLKRMEPQTGGVVGLVFTNHDISQISNPRGTAPIWREDPDNIARLGSLEKRLGVAWSKYQLRTEARNGQPVFLYVHLATRRNGAAKAAIRPGRAETIQDQNDRFPPVLQPELTAPVLTKVDRLAENRVRLHWDKPGNWDPASYRVLIRSESPPHLVGELPVTGLQAELTVPATKRWYAITVAGITGKDGERGRESEPVRLIGRQPALPVGALVGVLALLILLGVLVVLLRPITVRVEGKAHRLWLGRMQLALVGAKCSPQKPGARLSESLDLPEDGEFGWLRRTWAGRVQLVPEPQYLARVGGERTRSAMLAAGEHQVELLSNDPRWAGGKVHIQIGNRRGGAQANTRSTSRRPAGRQRRER